MEKFLLLLVATLTIASKTKTYRSDYTYNPKADAYYKLHIDAQPAWSIRRICKEEGSKLMDPLIPEDIVQVHSMVKQYPDFWEYIMLENDGKDHTSAEEVAIIDLTNQHEESQERSNLVNCLVMSRGGDLLYLSQCLSSYPFVCKVDAKDAVYNSLCGTYGDDYQYEASVDSCYRVSTFASSWAGAYAECRAENAHLVVINSQAEQEVVRRLLEAAPRVMYVRDWFFYFAGFRAEPPVGNSVPVFKTIFNQTLEEAGFAEWCPNEPNNAENREYCGAIFVNDGKLNDVDCSHKYGFICENNKKTINL